MNLREEERRSVVTYRMERAEATLDEVRVKNYWDYYSTVTTAEKKGRAEGLAEGEAKGEAKERIKNAKSLKENGVPIDIIAKSLGLTAEEIAAL